MKDHLGLSEADMNNKETDKRSLPALSKRLQTVAEMVPEGSIIADVGTDHGFVPIYLAWSGRIKHGIAMDVRKGPLERATEHVKEYGLEEMIETRLSDGLDKLSEGEADTMICAGMGGPLMQKILEQKDPRSIKISTLILEPQSEIMHFRAFLRKKGYEITQEEFLLEEGKYYPVIKALVRENTDNGFDGLNLPKAYEDAIKKLEDRLKDSDKAITKEQLIRICDRFGPIILTSPNADFKSFLVHGKEVCDTILSKISNVKQSHEERFNQLSLEQSDINIALHLF